MAESAYFLFLDNLPFAAVIINYQGHILYCNERLATVVGETKKFLRGRDIQGFIKSYHFESRVYQEWALPNLNSFPHQSKKLILSVVTPFGHVPMEMEVNSVSSPFPHGLLTLREMPIGNVWAQQASKIAIWECDMRSGVVYWSGAIEEIFGLSPAQFQDTYVAFLDCVHTDDRQFVKQQIVDCSKNFQKINAECRIVRPDGSIRWVMSGGDLLRDELGKPIRMVGAISDITERKNIEEALKQSEARWRLLLESTEEGIIGINTHFICTFVNRAAAEILGYHQEEMLGSNLLVLICACHEGGTPFIKEQSLIFLAMAQNHSYSTDDEVFWSKNGEAIPVQYSANPIREKDIVSGAVVVFRNTTESRAMAKKMDHMATHDMLTGLANRYEFERRLSQALLTAQDDLIQHVLCYMDLDQFKLVNDTCGHVAGDELLSQLARVLKEKLAPEDMLARLGGDEFGVLFEKHQISQAMPKIEMLRKAAQNYRFVWEDKTFSVCISIGVVNITAKTRKVTEVLSAADAACYAAKDSGRNRVHIYHEEDTQMSKRHGEMQWAISLHDTFEKEKFFLNYQKIVPINNRKMGNLFEVLVRMRDKQGNSVLPGAFIPAAERYNLMSSIDRWVVTTTFNCLQNNSRQFDKLELCSINLSGHSISEEQFMLFVVDSINKTGISGNKICFELTETTAVANLNQAAIFIKEMKKFGCRFALDDFGSGMSSFAYLKNLPVDYLKIDGNFVRDIVDDPVDLAMVKAINQVGQVMGIKTIAEFVENDRIFNKLSEIGVDFAQGYGIAMPQLMEYSAH